VTELPASVAVALPPLADDLTAALGTDLVALYLYGSAVSGGFDEDVSDVDLVAVTAIEAEGLDLAMLDRIHEAFVARDPEWTDRLEIVYLSQMALTAFGTEPGRLAVISPGETLHVTGPVRDWLQNWYLVRSTGIPVLGPPAVDVLPDIAVDEFLDGVRSYLAYLARFANRDDLPPGLVAYAVLSACRAVRTLRTGEPCSKQEGAFWIRDRRPDDASIIDEALVCRLARGRTGLERPRDRAAAVALVRVLARQVGQGDAD
jgi:Domain of unknown function (DUF4111)